MYYGDQMFNTNIDPHKDVVIISDVFSETVSRWSKIKLKISSSY
jgi:hypothetical protein